MKAKARMQRFAAVLVAFAVLVVAAPMLASAGEALAGQAQTIGETGSLAERATDFYKVWSKLDGRSWGFLAPFSQENTGSKADYLRNVKTFASFEVIKYEGLVINVLENPALVEQLVLPENAFLGIVTIRAKACLRDKGCFNIIHQTVWSWQQPPGTKAEQWYMVADGGREEEESE